MTLHVEAYNPSKKQRSRWSRDDFVAVVRFDYMVVGSLERNDWFAERLDWLKHQCGDEFWMGSHCVLFVHWAHAIQYVLAWEN